MSQLLITQTRFLPHGIRRRTLSSQVRFGSVTITLFLLVFFALIGLLSLRHFISSTTQGYRLKELEDAREKLLTEYQINAMLVDKARALAAVQESEVVKHMVKPSTERVVFIEDDMGVARK